jgi:hypothetical protein
MVMVMVMLIAMLMLMLNDWLIQLIEKFSISARSSGISASTDLFFH